MSILTQAQKHQFWADGFLVVKDAVSKNQLRQLQAVFTDWLEESRQHQQDYGETLDGRHRFDLDAGQHSGRK